MDLPKGFVRAGSVGEEARFVHEGRATDVLISRVPVAFDVAARAFEEKSLVGTGAELQSSLSWKMDGFTVRLFRYLDADSEVSVRLWGLVMEDVDSSVLVRALLIGEQKPQWLDELVLSLQTTRVVNKTKWNFFQDLGFQIGQGEGLVFESRGERKLTLAPVERFFQPIPDVPRFTVERLPRPVERFTIYDTIQSELDRANDVFVVQVLNQGETEIAGMKAYFYFVEGVHPKVKEPLHLFGWMIPYGNETLFLYGRVAGDQSERYAAEFEELAHSLTAEKPDEVNVIYP